jgi:hypothetical protein
VTSFVTAAYAKARRHGTRNETSEVGMICGGCGHELPAQASRGRQARFHDAACRQRAHRAQRASSHRGLLTAIAELEAAASELRRAALTGSDTAEAGSRLASLPPAAVEQLLHDFTPRYIGAADLHWQPQQQPMECHRQRRVWYCETMLGPRSSRRRPG